VDIKTKSKIWKTPMPTNDERLLEIEFLKKFAAEGDPEEDVPALPDPAGEEGGDAERDLDETLPEEDLGGELPNLDTDQAEMQAVKDLIPWDSFVIIFDPHYAKVLQDELTLPEPKAKSKSFYIYYSPENKRIEGIVNKRYVGGFGEKEELGEDFEFLKSLSPEGFPPDWKDKLLTNIDELPAVENSKVKEELKLKQKKEEEEPKEELPKEPKAEEPKAEEKPKAPEVTPPKPVGKVDTEQLAAKIKIQFKKISSRDI